MRLSWSRLATTQSRLLRLTTQRESFPEELQLALTWQMQLGNSALQDTTSRGEA